MAALSPKNRHKAKMKAKRKIPRTPVSRNQGNTAGVRTRLKKLAGKARAAKAKAAAAATA
jgi:hypothetical protein